MTAHEVPPPDWHIDSALVRDLLDEQHPDIAHLPIEPLASGWDNKMFRLGSDLIVRMPRRAAAIALMTREQRWLPELARRLPLPVPEPVRSGVPTSRYPAPWSIVPWLRGISASLQRCRANQAVPLARFLASLHVPADPALPRNPMRGVPLRERAATIEERLERVASKTKLVTPAIRAMWREALEAPPDPQETWVHGDLHARNVLVEGGHLTAVIDWGDICRGDRATDLAAIWMLLPNARARALAIEAYGPVPPGTWSRARGWAVSFAATLLDVGVAEDADYAAMGEHVFRQLGDAGP